jgi:hypothetical protein
MFESRYDMPPVATERAVIAIMQQEDVAVRAARAADAREPRNQPPGRLRFPVPAHLRPHDDSLHSRAADFPVQ